MPLKIIFHYPGVIHENFFSGESKRPFKMLEAFKSISEEVVELTGSYSERSRKWDEIKDSIGFFDCIYSENSNLPLSVCNEKKIPKRKSCDYQLFEEARKKKIPIGVYVRDLHWAMKGEKQKSKLKHFLSLPLYKSEMKLYNKSVSKIFLPTESFVNFQNTLALDKIVLLPPGCDFSTPAKMLENQKLLYVGSCMPPIYDIAPIFKETIDHDLLLTVITRAKDQEYLKNNFNDLSAITLKEASGNELAPYYKSANFFLMCLEKTPYTEIAMPIKVFEALSYNCPIIAYNYGEMAKLIKEHSLGWLIEDASQIHDLISNISSKEYSQIANNISNFAKSNTWKNRAQQVIDSLTPKP